jgi:hypothetical protein
MWSKFATGQNRYLVVALNCQSSGATVEGCIGCCDSHAGREDVVDPTRDAPAGSSPLAMSAIFTMEAMVLLIHECRRAGF